MGRRSFGVVCLLGVISASFAGVLPEFSFLTSETRSYAPSSNYFPESKSPPVVSVEGSGSDAPRSPGPRPLVRTLRGAPFHFHHHHPHHHYSSPPQIYFSKAPLHYPESVVFSDPLPVVPLPQLPSEFLSLKSTGAYGGSESEVPKKSSKKSPASLRQRQKSRPLKAQESFDDANEDEVTGGYPSSSLDTPSGRGSGRNKLNPKGNQNKPESDEVDEDEMEDAEPISPRQRQRSRPLKAQESFANDDAGEVSGGYPSSGMDASSGRGSGRSNQNQPELDEVVDDAAEETLSDDENEEIMMIGEDAEDDQDGNNQNDAREIEDAEVAEEAEKPNRGKSSKSGRRRPKTRGRGRVRSRGKGDDDDDAEALNQAISDDGPKIDSFFVPTFGNNVLNTVYPAFSQNSFLSSLSSQSNFDSYPASEMDISAISITNDSKKSRQSRKKKTSRRKNRPASKARSGRRGGSRKQQNSITRAQEPNQQNGVPQGQNGAFQAPAQPFGTSQQFSNNNAGGYSDGNQQQQYGAPQQQYGAPFQSGISPPSPNGSGFRTVNNELRQRTSDPPQFAQQPQQSSGRFLEPRQLSQGTFVSSNNQQFPNGQVNQELIRTVQAILEKYPN